MGRLKLFLSLSIFILSVLGCASIQKWEEGVESDLKKESEVETLRKSQVTYFGNRFGCGIYDGMRIQSVASDEGRAFSSNPEEWKKSFCSEGVQTRRLEFQVRGIVPPPPAGLVVTDAAELQERWRHDMRSEVQSFFMSGSKSYPKRKTDYTGCPGVISLGLFSTEPKAFESDQENKLYQLYSRQTTEQQRSQQFYYAPRNKSKKLPFMFLRLRGEKRFYLVEKSALVVGDAERADYPHIGKIGGVHTLTSPFFFVSDKDYPSRINDSSIPLLGLGFLGDLAMLRDNFVILAPATEQKAVFGSCLHCKDKEFNIKEFLLSREADFMRYVANNTVVEEAQTDNPNTVDFRVSLNLEPVCKYGRPVEQFISK